MKTRTIDVITMGCSKNLVDSEMLMSRFLQQGIRFFHNPDRLHGDIAVVNTCGFIGDAKEESINMILSLCQQKEEGYLNKIIVMGCLSERYRQELAEEIPQVDCFYGKFDWSKMLEDLTSENLASLASEKSQTSQKRAGTSLKSSRTSPERYQTSLPESLTKRYISTPPHYAYVKIAEGCDRKCAYCAIPIITGKHKSRKMEDILQEVSDLVKQGVREFQIIAQELTYYGVDLYGEQRLPELIDRMAQIEGVEWIRLHYAYPNHFPLSLLDVMNKHDNVCKYLDIALQHISDGVLNRMQRHTSKQETLTLLKTIRSKVPGICIRTTLMVGFCGETEEEFQELLDFTKETRFEKMGAFAYCEEEGTFAAENFEDDVSEAVKQQRLDELMNVQQQISAEICAERIGRTYKTIIDRQEGEYFIGRTEFETPEVDGEVLIKADGTDIRIGTFYQVEITDADEFDLYGQIVK